jgi:hypothetical protein
MVRAQVARYDVPCQTWPPRPLAISRAVAEAPATQVALRQPVGRHPLQGGEAVEAFPLELCWETGHWTRRSRRWSPISASGRPSRKDLAPAVSVWSGEALLDAGSRLRSWPPMNRSTLRTIVSLPTGPTTVVLASDRKSWTSYGRGRRRLGRFPRLPARDPTAAPSRMPLAMVERVGARFGNDDVRSYSSGRTASRYGVGEIADDDSAREASRFSTAHRRALERATEFPAGWKGEAWAESEDDDELGRTAPLHGTFMHIYSTCV